MEKAKTDPDAQAKADRLLKSPEFELYNIKSDPWEVKNLAESPEYAETVKKMHGELKDHMKMLNDQFSDIDPKAVKKAKKAKMKAAGLDPNKKKREKKKENAAK